MFTGIVEEVGRVQSAVTHDGLLTLDVTAQRVTASLPIGGSVAVNGCCLTATAVRAAGFTCVLTPETLVRTAFGDRLRPGVPLNLERPMRADGRFDGHIVQGHVDGVGRLLSKTALAESAEIVVELPVGMERYLVEKGSITVDGISGNSRSNALICGSTASTIEPFGARTYRGG